MLFRFGPLYKEADEGDGGGGDGEEKSFLDQSKPKDGKEGDGKPAKGKDEDEVGKLRKEAADKDRRIKELEASEKLWAGRAAGAGQQADVEEEDETETEHEDEDEDDPAKLIEDLTKHGAKALKKHGLMTIKEAEKLARRVAEEVADKRVGLAEKRLSSDAALLNQFGDLRDESSELYKRTREVLQEMVAEDKNLAKSPAILKAAATAAARQLKAEAKGGSRREAEEDGDEGGVDRAEESRRTRIRAQGERGGSGGNRDNDEYANVGPETSEIMRKMRIGKDSQSRVKENIAKARRTGRDGGFFDE